MNNRIFKVFVVAVLTATLLIVSTSSFAKYTKTDNSYATLNTKKQFYQHAYSSSDTDYLTFEPQYDGYYAIIVKGGNGGNGNKGEGQSNSGWSCRTIKEGQTGGLGGVMFGIFSTDDVKYLKMALGSAGGDTASKGIAGETGVNITITAKLSGTAVSVAQGSAGSNPSTSNAASGGSGAGSIVYSYSTKPGSDDNGRSLAMIAGGGGGSPGWDTAYNTASVIIGTGGSAGSNFSTPTNTTSIPNLVFNPSNGKVFSGYNGTDTATNPRLTYGYGGSTVSVNAGGLGGSFSKAGKQGSNYLSGNNLPTSGSGNGASANTSTCGGPGGGGYTGGGSGGWYDYYWSYYNPGGGGGGSSFISNQMSLDAYGNLSLLADIFDFMHTKSGYNTKTTSDGYVIIMYLGGKNESNTNILSSATSEFYSGQYTSNDAIPITVQNTGYYAVIAKGGNGGNGYWYNGGIKGNIYGGLGGITYGYVYCEANSVLTVFLGTDGGTPVPTGGNTRTLPGTAGTNGAEIGLGSIGANYPSGMGSEYTKNIASGGSGAATVVYLNGTDSKVKIVAIAGGGGGAASWDEGMNMGFILTTVPCGGGGDGGTNIPGNTLGQIMDEVSSGVWNGNVINGSNGLIDTGYLDSKITYGRGGSMTGGIAGKSSGVPTYGIGESTASAGQSPTTTATGGGLGGTGVDHGGSGGGGYAGGGGGAGTSINYSAGGGGGGSSYIKTGSGFGMLSNANKYTAFMSLAGLSANTKNGFYIIAYLGENEPAS